MLNCFYLVNTILQTIPQVSTNDPIHSLLPLLGVILVGMVLEAIADIKRYISDNKTNAEPATKIVCGDNATLNDKFYYRTD